MGTGTQKSRVSKRTVSQLRNGGTPAWCNTRHGGHRREGASQRIVRAADKHKADRTHFSFVDVFDCGRLDLLRTMDTRPSRVSLQGDAHRDVMLTCRPALAECDF